MSQSVQYGVACKEISGKPSEYGGLGYVWAVNLDAFLLL
jgi:hypothetical protein